MEQSGISKLDLKRCNRMQILKLLRQHGPTSRIDISRSLENSHGQLLQLSQMK